MIDERNHVCAQTPVTPVQRRAGLIADATVLANKTFGRDAIAALDGTWHADDEVAELRFTYEGHDWWLAPDTEVLGDGVVTAWTLGQVDTMKSSSVVIPAACPPATAAVQLRAALDGGGAAASCTGCSTGR